MFKHAYVSLPDCFIVVGVLAGFHDEGGRVARLVRGNLLSKLVRRAASGEPCSKDTLGDDAVEILKEEPRRHDITLSACIVAWRGEQISIVAAGNYDAWLAQTSGLSQVLVGSSVYHAAREKGVEVERHHKNTCTAALSSDRQKSMIQYIERVYTPTDTLVVTVGDVEPEWVLGRSRALGQGAVVFAVDEGADVRLAATLLCRRET